MRSVFFAVLLLAIAAPCAAKESSSLPVGTVRVVKDRFSGGYTLESAEAPLERIAAVLERHTGCRVQVDEKLRGRKLTLNLVSRPPERLFPVLGRRADARVSVRFRFEPLPPGSPRRPGPLAFAREPAPIEVLQPTELSEVLRDLDGSFDLAEGVRGRVSVRSIRYSLAQVLDHFAAQVNASWKPVVRFEERKFVDRDAETFERMQAHFHDLASLPPMERREELGWDLEGIEELPEDKREAAAQRIAADILSLGTHLHNTPGEHRGPVAEGVVGIAQDYAAVLSGITGSRRQRLRPIVDALAALDERLKSIR
jgi:hypothetical protein